MFVVRMLIKYFSLEIIFEKYLWMSFNGKTFVEIRRESLIYFSLEYCRQLDLRMNQMKFDGNDFILLNQLIYLTQLNLSHNHRIYELDLRMLNHLEYLHCSYNNTIRLIVNGHSLKQVNASHNSKIKICFLDEVINLFPRIETD